MRTLFYAFYRLGLVATVVCLIFSSILSAFQPASRELPSSAAYEAVESRHSYGALKSDKARKYYKKIEKAVYKNPRGENNELWSIRSKDNDDLTQAYLAITAFLEDHPDVFWVVMTTDFRGEFLGLESVYSKEELKQRKAEFNAALVKFLDSVPEGLSREQLEKYVHDYLIEHCEYDYDSLDENGDVDENYEGAYVVGEAYGALVNGKAVCAGYAKAYQLLLNRLGVDCVYITGNSEQVENTPLFYYPSTNHAWNAVKNGSGWVMTDVTWDDTGDTACCYDYFNLTKDEMFRNHFAAVLDQDIFEYNVFCFFVKTGSCLFLPV